MSTPLQKILKRRVFLLVYDTDKVAFSDLSVFSRPKFARKQIYQTAKR